MPKTNLTQIDKELKAAFFHEYETMESPISPFTLTINSDANEELYAFLANFPEIQEWKDARALQSLEDFDYTIKNKDYEGTIRVPMNDIEDGRVGGHLIAARNLAAAASDFFNDLVVEALEDNLLSFDGQNMFDTDHKIGDETAWANTRAGTGTTVAQLTTDLAASVTALLIRKNPKGKPFFKRDHRMAVIIPPQLKVNFISILDQQWASAGVPNIWYKRLDMIVLPQLTDVNNWYVSIVDTVIKPMILQIRKNPDWQRSPENVKDQTNTSDRAFMYNEVLFGTHLRGNVGYGWPHLIDRTTNA